jgi:hypothetical protein
MHSTRTLLGLTDARPPRGRRACTVTDDREVLRCVDKFKSSFQKVFSPDSVKTVSEKPFTVPENSNDAQRASHV